VRTAPRKVGPGTPPGGTSATRAGAGFSLVEVLVGTAVMVVLMVITYGMFVWTWKSFVKGDDTITSVYESSILMLSLRRDLQRMDFPDGESADFAVERFGASPMAAGADYRHSMRRMVPSTSVPPIQASTAAETTRYTFLIRQNAEVKQVSYTYYSSERKVRREGGLDGAVKDFAVPRLREFDLRLCLQPEGASAALLFPLDGLGGGVRPLQLWAKVRLRLQSDRGPSEMATTSVEVASNVFPKRLNALLRSRWPD
jgi:prepilin-type N-terminal cleavage/methylation domain-containing protein